MSLHSRQSKQPVRTMLRASMSNCCLVSTADFGSTDKKARDDLAKKAGGKGPMNTGQQGIKKSGKK